ncbi:MAG: HXXEE domain-containing protein [Bryobacteraceae bacterium]
MTQEYRFPDWFFHQWPRTTLPLAFFLLLLSPVVSAGVDTATCLIYLQLIAYLVHQYEEHAAGKFKEYANRLFGGGREVLGDAAIFWINVGGVWGVDLAAFYAAFYFGAPAGLVAVYLSLVNGVIHIGGALKERTYNPGLWTGIGLFLPLGGFTLYEFAKAGHATAFQHMIGLGLAILIHAAIIAHVVANRRRLGIART